MKLKDISVRDLSKKTNDELYNIAARMYKMAARTHNAIEKSGDWLMTKTDQHKLWTTINKDLERRAAIEGDTLTRKDAINLIIGLQSTITGKGGTLAGTKELVKHRLDVFVNAAKRAYEDAGTPENERLTERQLRSRARSKEFFNFLSSDAFRKLSESTGNMGSDKMIEQYLNHPDNALNYYDKYVSDLTRTGERVDYNKLTIK